ncbi:hypothetical protein BDR26DRAFT_871038 [Obelidium mucronatum]|nr:hypothetical protein BDR26DRAFT_871038 [Obelidium mucronatum]
MFQEMASSSAIGTIGRAMDPLEQLLMAAKLQEQQQLPTVWYPKASSTGSPINEEHRALLINSRNNTIGQTNQSISAPPESHLLLITSKAPVTISQIAASGSLFNSRQEETFHGFIKDPIDAAILAEAVIANLLKPFRVTETVSHLLIGHGTVVVLEPEAIQSSELVFCKVGKSLASACGLFSIYREVEPTVNNNYDSSQSRHHPQTKQLQPKLVPNGLCKKVITVIGSDTRSYCIVSYFRAKDVAHHYGDSPILKRNSHLVARVHQNYSNSGWVVELPKPDFKPQVMQDVHPTCLFVDSSRTSVWGKQEVEDVDQDGDEVMRFPNPELAIQQQYHRLFQSSSKDGMEQRLRCSCRRVVRRDEWDSKLPILPPLWSGNRLLSGVRGVNRNHHKMSLHTALDDQEYQGQRRRNCPVHHGSSSSPAPHCEYRFFK